MIHVKHKRDGSLKITLSRELDTYLESHAIYKYKEALVLKLIYIDTKYETLRSITLSLDKDQNRISNYKEILINMITFIADAKDVKVIYKDSLLFNNKKYKNLSDTIEIINEMLLNIIIIEDNK